MLTPVLFRPIQISPLSGYFRHLASLLLLFLGANASLAQTAEPLPILCGNEVFDYIVREHYPDLHQAFRTTFDDCRAKPVPAADRSPSTIRVVVHVVWKNPEENLADSVILDQMAGLNEDYNRQNADTANLRSIFQPVAGNPQINFELAQIVRVQTNANFQLNLLGGELMTNLKTTAQGGSDAWDPTQYLNIWICKIQPITILGITIGQILGFAFPPNNLDNWPANSGAPALNQDGVVLDFRTVGRNNPNPIANPNGGGNLVIRGRTATHEVGHYLGLRHIWGDGGGLLGTNDCNQSDGIDDTPFANGQSPFDCNKSRNTCTKVEPHYGMDMPDLVENYMDYSSESCMNMFTQGQAAHIQSVLAGPRKSLVQTSSVPPMLVSEQILPVLYPNPARTSNRVWLDIPANWQPTSVEVASADGRIVQHLRPPVPANPQNQRLLLDTQGLQAGWYAVRVLTDTPRVWVQRLLLLP